MTVGDDRCPDCQVKPGERHDNSCDVARCQANGLQRLQCDALGGIPVLTEIDGETVLGRITDGHDCGHDVWTGKWPGETECEEYGWFARMVPGQGWVPCGRDDPGAMHDLNLLITQCTWDTKTARWQRKNEGEPR